MKRSGSNSVWRDCASGSGQLLAMSCSLRLLICAAMSLDMTALVLIQNAAKLATPTLLSRLVPVLIANGERPASLVRRWLEETTDSTLAEQGAQRPLICPMTRLCDLH